MATSAPATRHEHHDREEPDQELRRNDLAEGDERDDRRGGIAREASGARGVTASESHPHEREGSNARQRRHAPTATEATVPVRFCEPALDAQPSGIPKA